MSFARIRAIVVVSALVVCAAVFVTIALVKDTQTRTKVTANCPAGSILVDAKLPESKAVKLRVYNGSGHTGEGSSVAEDFTNRRFKVVARPKDYKHYDGVALLRYGPKAVGSAWLLRAYFLDEADTAFDKKRTNDVVDVVLGSDFRQLGTSTEVNQSIALLGNPQLPPGTCAQK
jgi:hypothetical protein